MKKIIVLTIILKSLLFSEIIYIKDIQRVNILKEYKDNSNVSKEP